MKTIIILISRQKSKHQVCICSFWKVVLWLKKLTLSIYQRELLLLIKICINFQLLFKIFYNTILLSHKSIIFLLYLLFPRVEIGYDHYSWCKSLVWDRYWLFRLRILAAQSFPSCLFCCKPLSRRDQTLNDYNQTFRYHFVKIRYSCTLYHI